MTDYKHIDDSNALFNRMIAHYAWDIMFSRGAPIEELQELYNRLEWYRD